MDFVTSRGNLARILDIQNGKDGKGRKWTLLATRYRGTVYLSHIEDNRDEEMSSFARRICYWGKRFEVEVTAPPGQDSLLGYSRGNEEERYGPMKAYPGFFSVVRFQLEGHKIVLRAEIDAQTQVSDSGVVLDYSTFPNFGYFNKLTREVTLGLLKKIFVTLNYSAEM